MTIEAGVILNLASACDELLKLLYFRRPQEIDINEIELDYRSEVIEMAANTLAAADFIEIIETSHTCSYRITPKGQVKYRTSSFVSEEAEKKRQKRFQNVKSILEVVFGAGALILTFYTFTLDNKIDKQATDLELYRQRLARQEERTVHLNEEISRQLRENIGLERQLDSVKANIKIVEAKLAPSSMTTAPVKKDRRKP